MTFRSSFLPGAGPLDIAFDAQATRMAVIALNSELIDVLFKSQGVTLDPAGILDPRATLWLSPWDTSELAFRDTTMATSVKLSGQPVAVAFFSGRTLHRAVAGAGHAFVRRRHERRAQ